MLGSDGCSRTRQTKFLPMCPFLFCMVVLYHVNDSRCKGPITQHSSNNSLARNNGRPTDNVRTESDRWVDRSTFHRSCWLVTFNCIEMKQIKISMLFSCFSCYQYVASHCVLQNFIWNPGRNATIPIVYNSCIKTDIRVHTLSVTKLKIFPLSLVRQQLFNGHI